VAVTAVVQNGPLGRPCPSFPRAARVRDTRARARPSGRPRWRSWRTRRTSSVELVRRSLPCRPGKRTGECCR